MTGLTLANAYAPGMPWHRATFAWVTDRGDWRAAYAACVERYLREDVVHERPAAPPTTRDLGPLVSDLRTGDLSVRYHDVGGRN